MTKSQLPAIRRISATGGESARPGDDNYYFGLPCFFFLSSLSSLLLHSYLCLLFAVNKYTPPITLHAPSSSSSPYFCPASAAMSASGSGIPNAASGSSSGVKKAFPQVDLSGHNLPPSPAPSSPHAGRRYNIATELVFTEGSDQYNASSVPIYQVYI
jgi:hypothetical protein